MNKAEHIPADDPLAKAAELALLLLRADDIVRARMNLEHGNDLKTVLVPID